jgi:hypothetical protein
MNFRFQNFEKPKDFRHSGIGNLESRIGSHQAAHE